MKTIGFRGFLYFQTHPDVMGGFFLWNSGDMETWWDDGMKRYFMGGLFFVVKVNGDLETLGCFFLVVLFLCRHIIGAWWSLQVEQIVGVGRTKTSVWWGLCTVTLRRLVIDSSPVPERNTTFSFGLLDPPGLDKAPSRFANGNAPHDIPMVSPSIVLPRFRTTPGATAPGSEDYLRVELVLEPDHATSCQCFRPKEQLLEHLEQLMGRAPTTQPGSKEGVEPWHWRYPLAI